MNFVVIEGNTQQDAADLIDLLMTNVDFAKTATNTLLRNFKSILLSDRKITYLDKIFDLFKPEEDIIYTMVD